MGVGWYGWHSNQAEFQRANKLVSENDRSVTHIVPTTKKPTVTSIENYTVDPTQPRYLIIPKLRVHARILPVSLDKGGAIDTPFSIFDTGWYNKSAQPGQLGAMVIDGHVSSDEVHGVFYNLESLRAGDSIDVQGGNGAVFMYRVVKIQEYDAHKVDMIAVMKSVNANPPRPGLNLITCSGDVAAGTNEFSKRLIVFAAQD
ncbi:MAG TPA: class F sortase [Patescibacteria group bacterium]|nr:class F sortase [Patescibacteria group bacterium]